MLIRQLIGTVASSVTSEQLFTRLIAHLFDMRAILGRFLTASQRFTDHHLMIVDHGQAKLSLPLLPLELPDVDDLTPTRSKVPVKRFGAPFAQFDTRCRSRLAASRSFSRKYKNPRVSR